MCVSGGKKCSSFGLFGVPCFLEKPVLRFALLPYYQRIHDRVSLEKLTQIRRYLKNYLENYLPFSMTLLSWGPANARNFSMKESRKSYQEPQTQKCRNPNNIWQIHSLFWINEISFAKLTFGSKTVAIWKNYLCLIFGIKYSRMDQVKFLEESP